MKEYLYDLLAQSGNLTTKEIFLHILVSALIGMAIFLFRPLWGLAADIAGMLVVFRTGFLPLGAVVITTLFTVFAGVFYGTEPCLLALALALIMLSRHYPGLIRSLTGTEEKNAQYLKRKK